MGTRIPVLQIDDLSITYASRRGRVQALRHVTLDVPENSVVGIVGESGCGKSTLINSVLRLLPPNADRAGGTIRLRGEDLFALDENAMRNLRGTDVSMVFQDPMTSLNPALSVGRQMFDIQYRMPGSKAEKMARAARMLTRVGIPDPDERLKSYPHEFSGGMRQRIAIAMAIMMNPVLLIADEPTTALDVTLEAQIIKLLRDLKTEMNGSILVTSHHLGLIAELSDYVAVMYAGEVVEQGTVHDIFHHPRHPYTVRLLAADPHRIREVSRRLPTIPGSVPDLVRVPAGCVFAPRCLEADETCRTTVPDNVSLSVSHSARCFRCTP